MFMWFNILERGDFLKIPAGSSGGWILPPCKEKTPPLLAGFVWGAERLSSTGSLRGFYLFYPSIIRQY